MLSHIASAGYQPGTVPAIGHQVSLRRNGNLSIGGTSKDVTDQVHPDVGELCRRAAAVTGLDICGIDLRLEHIGGPLFAPTLAGPAAAAHARQAAAGIETPATPALP